jgi:hypothetical protein
MNEITNTTSNATTAASATHYYARIGNPPTWKQVSRG